MPVSKKESDGIALKLASQAKELSEQEYKDAEQRLIQDRTTQQLSEMRGLDISDVAGTRPRKDVELDIELMIIWEEISLGLGWWGRTKRRFELVKKYQL